MAHKLNENCIELFEHSASPITIYKNGPSIRLPANYLWQLGEKVVDYDKTVGTTKLTTSEYSDRVRTMVVDIAKNMWLQQIGTKLEKRHYEKLADLFISRRKSGLNDPSAWKKTIEIFNRQIFHK